MLSNIQADWQTASVQGRDNYKSNTHLFYMNFFFGRVVGGEHTHSNKSFEASLTDRLKTF